MHLKEKINFKVYIVLTVLILLLTAPFLKSVNEFLVILLVYSSVILNQWLLINFVDSIIVSAAENLKVDKGQMILSVLGKTLIVVLSLSFGVHIMGNRIIIPLLIYICQIFILYFSLIKKENDT